MFMLWVLGLWTLVVAHSVRTDVLKDDDASWLSSRLLDKEVTGWFGGYDMIPVNLEGREERLMVLVARVQMGGHRSVLRLVMDFNEDDVILASTGWSQRSATLRTVAGVSTEIMYVAGEDVRVPVRFDPAATFERNCPTCNGVLGLGRGSVLWTHWPNITMSNGNLWMGGRADWEDWDRVDCGPPPQRGLCEMRGVHAVVSDTGETYGPYRMRLEAGTRVSFVPPDLYDAWTGGRSLELVSSPASWPALDLQVPSESGEVVITLPPEQLVVGGGGTPREIMLKAGGESDLIVLSDGAWQQFTLHMNARSGRAGLQRWHSRQTIGAVGKVLIVVMTLVVLVWKLTPTPFTVHQHAFGVYPSSAQRSSGHAGVAEGEQPSIVATPAAGRVLELDRNFQRVLRRELQPNFFDYREYEGYVWTGLELFTVLVAGAVWFSSATRIALRGEPILDLTLLVFGCVCTVGVALGVWGFWSSSRVRNGKGSGNNGGLGAIITARLFVGHGLRAFTDSAVMVRMAHARVSVMRTAANEMLAGLAILLILTENRADTLATFIAGIAAYLMMVQLVYHLALHAHLLLEGAFSFPWLVWCNVWGGASALLWWLLAEVFIVHLVRRHVYTSSWLAWTMAMIFALTSVIIGLVVVPATHAFLVAYVYEGRFLRAGHEPRRN